MQIKPSSYPTKADQLRIILPGLKRILERFSPLIQQQRWLITGSFTALLFETALRLLDPWPLKFVFDELILKDFKTHHLSLEFLRGASPLTVLSVFASAIVVIAVFRAVAAYLSTVGMALAASHIMTEVRDQLYQHLQQLSMSFYTRNKSGDLIARVTQDVDRLKTVTVTALLPLLTNVFSLLGMLTVMLVMNLELGLIALMVLPIFLLTANRVSKKIRRISRQQRQREGDMAATVSESVGAMKVIQAFSLQGMLGTIFSEQNHRSHQDGAKTQTLAAELERIVEALVAIATSLILWWGVQLILQGKVTPGDLLVFFSYLKVAFKPMRQLAKYTGQLAKAAASGERILDLLDTMPDIQNVRGAKFAPPLQGYVQCDRVTFAYNPDSPILRQLSFQVNAGQKIAVVGPSGGGKSSFVSLLLRLYDPLEGRILIDGHDLREYQIDSLRRQMSIVLQDSILFAVSIRKNIAYGCLEASEGEIIAAAKLANAHDFIMNLPQGYDTILSERGSTLSGGQRQRIAIARAAIRKAPIIILDEPTTGLDQENEQAVTEALNRLTRGKTTFWITHNLNAARQADQIFYIERGQILEQGTHQELLRRGERYAALYALQSAIPPAIPAICAAST
ncbi:MAG: ABC transporter ATP-binding protein [Synechococcales bacterium]|nr:ABC transporter ATP-binding protein [Synechococcales bacterium]